MKVYNPSTHKYLWATTAGTADGSTIPLIYATCGAVDDNSTALAIPEITAWTSPTTGSYDMTSWYSFNNAGATIYATDIYAADIYIPNVYTGVAFDIHHVVAKKMEMARRRQALLPSAGATRFGLRQTNDIAELRARQLLKSLIGGEMFRRYLKDGFISITSPVTGLVYQIFPGHKNVVVRDKGTRASSCCIVFKDSKLPPTDWVIMRMSLILADEQMFYQKANVYGAIPERIRAVA